MSDLSYDQRAVQNEYRRQLLLKAERFSWREIPLSQCTREQLIEALVHAYEEKNRREAGDRPMPR